MSRSMRGILPLVAIFPLLLACGKDSWTYFMDVRADASRGSVILRTEDSDAIEVRAADGDVLTALYAPKEAGVEAKYYDPISMRFVEGQCWYTYGNTLFQCDLEGTGVLRRIQLYSLEKRMPKDSVFLMDTDGEHFVVSTTRRFLYDYNLSKLTVYQILQGGPWDSNFWEVRVLPGQRVVTVGGRGGSPQNNWYASPRGLYYFTFDPTDGVSIYDLATAKRLFRVDVDGKTEVSGRTFLWYEPPNLLHGAGWDSPDQLWTLNLATLRIERVCDFMTSGPFILHEDKALEASREDGIWVVQVVPRNPDRWTHKELTQLKFGFPPGSVEIIGLAWDEKSQTCVAYDSTGGLYGVKVDWEHNTLKKVWSLSRWEWRRKLKLLPHLREGAVLPPLEVPKFVDLEAPLRAPVPEEYTPGEPAPDVWARVEKQALMNLSGLGSGGDVERIEQWIRSYRSRGYALKWAQEHDARFYKRLVDEGPEGWEAWREKNVSDEERFARKLLGKP
jgi:hypothetical protein